MIEQIKYGVKKIQQSICNWKNLNAAHDEMINSKPVVQRHMLGSLNFPKTQSGKHLSSFSGQTRSNQVKYKIIIFNPKTHPFRKRGGGGEEGFKIVISF